VLNVAGQVAKAQGLVTVAFTLLIHARLTNADIDDSFPAFCSRNLDLLVPRSGLLELHYNPSTLAFSEANQAAIRRV
jgi:hypothetical protein